MSIDALLEGIVGGTASGVVIAIILNWYEKAQKKQRHKEQVRYLSSLIREAKRQIRNANTPAAVKGEVVATPEQVRSIIYESLLRDLNLALEGRSGDLPYTQRHDLKRFIIHQQALLALIPNNKVLEGMTFYENHVFTPLSALTWLDDN